MSFIFYRTLLIVFIISFTSCELTTSSLITEEPELPVLIENLSGTWNCIQSLDSTNHVVDEPALNNTRCIIISRDFLYKEFVNDTLRFQDYFNLYKTVFRNTSDTLTVIDWRTSRGFNLYVFSLKTNTLVLGNFRGYKTKYTRINGN